MSESKNILVLIPNYGTHQIDYLYKILEEYSKFKHINPTITLFSTNQTKNINNKHLNITEILVDERIGLGLSQLPRVMSMDNVDRYDYYMHQENDTLITEDNIMAFIDGQERLDAEFGLATHIHGLVRYELIGDNCYFIDMHKSNTHSIGKIIDDKLLVDNVHQGGWLINNNHLKVLMNRNLNYGDTLEDSCSNFFYSQKWPGHINGIPKLIYKDLIERCIIHHMPNKYSNLDNNYLTLKELLQ